MKLNLALLACASAALALTSCKKAAQTVPPAAPPPAPASTPAPGTGAQPTPLSGPLTTADGRSAKVLQQAEIGPLLNDIPKGAAGTTFIVDGDRRFDGEALIVDRLEFKSAAVLTFGPQALQSRRNLLIVAREMVSDDPQHPGKITYASPQAGPAEGSGQARTAPEPPREGQGGSAGRKGEAGLAGAAGVNAPNLTLIVMSVAGGGPTLAFGGAPGQVGGQGRQGGEGGAGGRGRPASGDTFKCDRAAANGAPGGAGGAGGAGGQGGNGGGGGTVTLLGLGDRVSGLLQGLRVDTAGGEPGQGGLAGKGGLGGLGGQGGQGARPFCAKNGRPGLAGAAGQPGGAGSAGQRGVDGDLRVGAISEANFNRILAGK